MITEGIMDVEHERFIVHRTHAIDSDSSRAGMLRELLKVSISYTA